jgi:ATP-dependent helicase YprA (DUF1998 family)
MNVFDLRNSLVADYRSYVSSFIHIRDTRIREYVTRELDDGLLWPEPLVQLNPAFERGHWIDDLVTEGLLHEGCRSIFRRKRSTDDPGEPLRLHRHQEDAIRTARGGDNYVLTTGTGSGKSLSYIIPIVDHVLRCGSGKGIQAIIVYPMNALANSQKGELEKFVQWGLAGAKQAVTFARYTGQEKGPDRDAILENPPDILLTNYVMLELLLTRPHDKRVIDAARGLRFLVLDELHTYRGRQGADVAMLIRRTRDRMEAPALQCVGTSATMASGGTLDDQRREVARVASLLFGSEVKEPNVIGETLQRVAEEPRPGDPAWCEVLKKRVNGEPAPADFDAFRKDPLAGWIEATFGVEAEPGSGRLRRRKPSGIRGPEGAAKLLAVETGSREEAADRAIRETLMAGFKCVNPHNSFPVFAFRVHQLLTQGDQLYASLGEPAQRYVTVHGQEFVPGSARQQVLLPLAFCRECGQEFYVVRRTLDPTTDRYVFEARDIHERAIEEDAESGFLYSSDSNPWPEDPDEVLERLPDEWKEFVGGRQRINPKRREFVPQAVTVGLDGRESDEGLHAHFLLRPFYFCPACGVSYAFRQAGQSPDTSRLALLGFGGRATATTVLSLSSVRHLRQTPLPEKARKLLSFTDNRQDASLQAGHFNDFVEITLLRAALHRACLEAGPSGLSHEQLTTAVFNALQLPRGLWSLTPEAKFAQRTESERAFREVIGYRLYRDLERGWRLTSPNLEQCGLLEIEYASLEEACASEEDWQRKPPALLTATPETRLNICRTLLDYLRRQLAVDVIYLDKSRQDGLRQLSGQHLREPWALDEDERLQWSAVVFPRSRRPGREDEARDLYLSARSDFGQFLRRPGVLPHLEEKLSTQETDEVIRGLLAFLHETAGLLRQVREPSGKDDAPGYQLLASAMHWKAGDGTRAFFDPLRMPQASEHGRRTNAFFLHLYREMAAQLRGMEAREHTAQVQADERERREKRFRDGALAILYCSPTMELGVDISELHVVNLRNMPPTPANYAQRSGRAGRSGQPAMVFTYCAVGSPHDQYFYKRPDRMVAGVVSAPRIDVANEDLVRAHVHAVWLAETGEDLGRSLKDLLELEGVNPSLALVEGVRQRLSEPAAKQRASMRAKAVLGALVPRLEDAGWYSDGWLDEVLNQVMKRFDDACARWRDLYRGAMAQFRRQTDVISDATRTKDEKDRARRLRREAEAQMELLTDTRDNVLQSDFYSYRYFASEGFLPGYSFPRLPVSAFIPARQTRRGEDEYLSRPRFLAVSEFGPRAIVYHEGSRYEIDKVIRSAGDDEVATTQVKLCEKCGYLHPIPTPPGPDVCDQCHQSLPTAMTHLFRLQNVSTRRRDRITSDEEERQRQGYELKTGVRFSEHDHRRLVRSAEVTSDGTALAHLTYGHAATLWRINFGWTRRKNKKVLGFVLDLTNSRWSSKELLDDRAPEEPDGPKAERVIPFVEDTRNCMVFYPEGAMSIPVMATLQAALKNAIQIEYQLEDSELAAEPLPSRDPRQMLLLYESAEGGAGVLRHLVDDASALSRVARRALELCHFDPDTGEDRGQAPNARERCEKACYDCLMGYGNQWDHRNLDRFAVRDHLLRLASGTVQASPVGVPRAVHLQGLMARCDSELERDWLRFLEGRALRLPTRSQVLFRQAGTKPDFVYEDQNGTTAIYVDGPVHDYPDRHARDASQTAAMEDLGIRVLRFHHSAQWESIVADNPSIFGGAQ